ncbi:mycothiol system anti-sigma-R factor [Aeromicrobium chenweiae]|uniref:Mycothiol system anti-sigma-R factor n=1 Tax=Aeromicrobium chenweiae TaxID=2079793 RepID=A0A2S0WJQ1_9ACTN|nr:mycothiol system anti-sigma-R factor [Aeromicrobium chenweiae]AWB91561.1 mycothiol system anti-sigma-R factor [Aeromicrobium chenweiae]TGN32396.1 mycothiol system anti-sigma-R factor [Aeromicrobium chenweiae]
MSTSNCEGPDCEKALENLYLFIDHEIDTASCAEIQNHIDECTTCLSEYDLERVVKSLVSRSCSEVAPEPLRDKVLMSIRTVQVTITEQKQA